MTTPMVSAKGVTKSYGAVDVLRGVTLEVARGEVTCLIGPSGSGKSTLLRCINHLEKHDAGELRVDGELVGYEARGGKLYERNDKQICSERAQLTVNENGLDSIVSRRVFEPRKGQSQSDQEAL